MFSVRILENVVLKMLFQNLIPIPCLAHYGSTRYVESVRANHRTIECFIAVMKKNIRQCSEKAGFSVRP